MQRRALAQPRRDLAAVDLRNLSVLVHDRDDDTAVEVLVAALAQNPERLQPLAQLGAPARRQPVGERAVREAELEAPGHLGGAQPPLLQVLERFGALRERLVIVADHVAQECAVVGVGCDGDR